MKAEARAAQHLRATGAPLDALARVAGERSLERLPRRKAKSRTALRSSICVGRRFALPAAQVFEAWLDPSIAAKWLFATAWRPMTQVAIDARLGGAFRLAQAHRGETIEYIGAYIEIAPPRRLVFGLALAAHPPLITRVSVDIAPLKRGCKLGVIHENVPRAHAGGIKARWTGILYGLGVTLDAGAP